MVLFKHGVAYLERGGPAEGSFELSFEKDEMNDVLKSLAVWVVRGDAQVGAMAFESPEDPEEALAERKLVLAPGAALEGLLGALRGRSVRVDDGGSGVRGEVVGVQQTPAGDGSLRRQLCLRTSPSTVVLVDLGSARGVELLEEPSRADLGLLIDKSRAATAGVTRTVKVALSGKADDLRVAYVIPAPVWRVSYRIAKDGGQTLLFAMGIVHNPADEDLADIELTLTTGQPVSFVIDLYNPKRVQRAVVEEQTRAVAAPTRFERARRTMVAPGPAAFGPPQPAAAPAAAAGPYLAEEASFGGAAMSAGFQAAAEGAAEGIDRGELFEYRVRSRISLKRGGSAMVPLVAAPLSERRERIWRDGAPPFPDLVLSFKNETGVVLEEGPAVVYDAGSYAGESMLPYSARSAEVKLSFAKDLAVRCRRETRYEAVAAGVRMGDAALVEEVRHEQRHLLVAESDHDEPVDVIFELPRHPGRTVPPDATQPLEETASFRRFSATVPPHGKAEVATREVWLQARHVAYQQMAAAQLGAWLEARFLDRATFDALRAVLDKWAEAKGHDDRRAATEREREQAYAKQTKISEQLAVLRDSGPEGALRLRYVQELEAEQNKVNAAEDSIRRLVQQADEARREAAARLVALTASR